MIKFNVLGKCVELSATEAMDLRRQLNEICDNPYELHENPNNTPNFIMNDRHVKPWWVTQPTCFTTGSTQTI